MTFAVRPEGLTVAVLIGLNNQDAAALAAAGSPIPPPVWGTGLLDTGCDITSVAPTLLRRLPLARTGGSSSQTVGGQVSVELFEVSLSIPPPGGAAGPLLVRPHLVVMELPHPIAGIDVLIGLDVLLTCRLLLDGPGRQFTLDF